MLATRYRLTPGQIDDAVTMAAAASADDPEGATGESLAAAARAQSGGDLASLARRVEPVHRWAELVLPGGLAGPAPRAVRPGGRRVTSSSTSGASAERLVAGPGGQRAVRRPVGHRQDHGRRDRRRRARARPVQDRPGRGGQQVHRGDREEPRAASSRAAEQANAILFFDEADALFGKRSEVTRRARPLRQHRGRLPAAADGGATTASAILATNLRQNIDEAFLRRLDVHGRLPVPRGAPTGCGSGGGSARPRCRSAATSTWTSWPRRSS